jgi:hypothetical protein
LSAEIEEEQIEISKEFHIVGAAELKAWSPVAV